MISVLIGGDVCPMGKIQDSFIRGDTNEIFHDLADEIASADLSVVNLECPLVSRRTPISKAGPVLTSSTNCIEGFKVAKWDVLNLANNHSYDHGAEGLRDTLNAIEKAGLHAVGAGFNAEDANIPYVTKLKDQRIVVYSMAEREFSFADEKNAGANPLDLINFVSAIQLYKQHGIFIVLIHGGKEFYSYPTPEMIRRCHFMVDMGAAAVICCHTHCPLPWELYAGRPIVYGLGNLVFETAREQPEDWYKGYLAKLTFNAEQVGFEAIPYFQSQKQLGARKMSKIAQEHFFTEMQNRNIQIQDRKFIENQWAKYCREHEDTYLSRLFAYNQLIGRLRKVLFPILHSERSILRALLLVQCETHREILDRIFREKREKSRSL
jgi:poly-gamma-glutamate capsule biosynthesis protein CapA/YwtB (metallophosphatase superfamily)